MRAKMPWRNLLGTGKEFDSPSEMPPNILGILKDQEEFGPNGNVAPPRGMVRRK